jgi:hypothetical protein
VLVRWASGSRVALPNPGNDVLARVPLVIGGPELGPNRREAHSRAEESEVYIPSPGPRYQRLGSKSKKVIKEALLPEAEQSSE